MKNFKRDIAAFLRDKVINRILRKKIKNKNISIISSNCNGGVIYHDLGLKFLSPTINLYFQPDEFIKFIDNLEYYLALEVKEVVDDTVRFPIGIIGDVKIYFLHYKSFNEAKEKWDKRKKRVNFNNIYVIFTDRDGCNKEMMKKFDSLKIKNKIIFTHKKFDDIKSAKYIKGFENDKSVGILSEYENILGKRYLDQFKYIEWFNRKKED